MKTSHLAGLLGRGAVLAAAAMMICAPMSSASSMTLANGVNQGLCLDAQTYDGRTLTGKLQMYACNGGRAQQWL